MSSSRLSPRGGSSSVDEGTANRDDLYHTSKYPLDFSWGYAWPKPPILLDEHDRLDVLRSFDILDTPTEDEFDTICDLASDALKCPMAAVSFVDEDRQWFKASVGLAQSEIPRNVSFCAHTIFSQEPMVVLDTLQDRRFAKNPLVTGGASIRFYAGSPIVAPSGHILGTVLVFDSLPRESCDVATLEKLSGLAMKHLEDRKNAAGRALPPVPTTAVVTGPPPPSVAQPSLISHDSVVQTPDNDQAIGGPTMDAILKDLLRRTAGTQQEGVMFETLSQHPLPIENLADAIKRMEAKLDAQEALKNGWVFIDSQ